MFVDVFTDYQQKYLKGRLDHTRGYLSSFAFDERKEIAHRFLNKIEDAITRAYQEAIEEDEALYQKRKKQ